MYRDSTKGLVIDVSGPDGNAFALMGYARQICNQTGEDHTPIIEEMMQGDYNMLLNTFEKYFPMVRLLNKPGEFDVATNDCPNCVGAGCDECDGIGEIFE